MPFITALSFADIFSGVAQVSNTDTGNAASYLRDAISNVDFAQVVTGIVGIAPTILPIIVTILAFKKGLNWCLRLVRRS